MATYLQQIKQNNPDAYNKIANLAQYTANENFGGNIQDYQAQIFTPLDTEKAGIPKKLDFKPTYRVNFNEDEYTTAGGEPIDPNVTKSVDADSNEVTYKSSQPFNVNGLPVYANYDSKGNLTGYQGDPKVVTWLDGGHYARGNWDAQGNPSPITIKTQGGGFIDKSDLGALIGLAASYFGAPLIGEALGLTGTAGSVAGNALINAASGKDFGQILTSAATGTAGGLVGDALGPVNIDPAATAGDYTNQMDLASDAANAANATNLVNATNLGTGLGAKAATYTGTGLQGPNAANLSGMGGGQGILSNATTSNLASMDGGQGLTTAGTGLTAGTLGAGGTALSGLLSGISSDVGANSLLGATGGTVPYGGLGSNIGTTGLASGVGSLLGDGAASTIAKAIASGVGGGTGTGGGTGLSNGLGLGLSASALASLLGAYTNTQGIKDAMNAINSGVTSAQGTLKDVYGQQQGYARPYMATGTNALSNLGALGTGTYQMYDEKGNPTGTGTGSGYLQHQFDASDLAKGLAPNYDFMLQQGQMANQRAANMAGGGFGGNALQGLNRYTQDYAGNAYQNAFKNYQDQRQNIFGNLSNLANLGSTQTGNLMSAGTSYGKSVADLEAAKAKALADAQVAMAGQNAGALQSIGNTALLGGLLSQNPNIAQTGSSGINLSNLGGTALSSLLNQNPIPPI